MPAIHEEPPDIPHLLRKRQNVTARSASRGALLAKQTVKNKSEPISIDEIVRICFVW